MPNNITIKFFFRKNQSNKNHEIKTSVIIKTEQNSKTQIQFTWRSKFLIL